MIYCYMKILLFYKEKKFPPEKNEAKLELFS